MNLTVDIGNTNIMLCFFKEENIFSFKNIGIESLNKKTILNFVNQSYIDKKELCVLISSVVPEITRFFTNIFDIERINYFFARKVAKKFNLKTNLKNKSTIGDDRLINSIYAKFLYSKSVIIIDFGTATTLDVLDRNGIYDGGVITPGIDLSLKSLQQGTAKLPLVKFKKTKKIVGKSTTEAIQSGFFWGYVSMIEGLINKIQREKKEKFKIILTGGNSNYFSGFFENVVKNDELFNSKALNFLIIKYLRIK
ncbi:MAG: type III pantothenate kinase [Pseudomonadota bacterium]|nr:type III pantothenate kinase [Pseudomonadota bacterium]